MTRRVGALLWAGVVVLASVVALEAMTGPAPPVVPQPRPAEAGRPGPASILADRSPGWVETILARPLFNADRRPVAAAAMALAGPNAGTLPRLAGLVITPGARYAIFAAGDGGKQVAVAEGGRIGAYTVGRIDNAGVSVTGPGGEHVIHPSFATGSESAAADKAPPGLTPPLDLTPSGLSLIRNLPNIPIPAAPQR